MNTQKIGIWFFCVMALIVIAVYGCSGASKQLTDADRSLQPTGDIEDGVRVIQLQAKQYEFSPDPMVVRVGERVRIEAVSMDVEHGLDIPGYNINRKLQPGKPENITFIANQEGVFPTHCSVYCGWGHMFMHGRLVVVPAQK
jgi:cytochrome c oxidase subunit II